MESNHVLGYDGDFVMSSKVRSGTGPWVRQYNVNPIDEFSGRYSMGGFDVAGAATRTRGAADALKYGLLTSSGRPDVFLAARHHAHNVRPRDALPSTRGRLSLGRSLVERVHRLHASHAVGDARSQARSGRVDGVARRWRFYDGQPVSLIR